jgi:aldehyde:ferredoxin oxidoreductase
MLETHPMLECYRRKVLRINLSTNSIVEEDIPDELFFKFFGGKGLASFYVFPLAGKKIDPLSPQNIIAFFTGPLTGTIAPSSNRFMCVTKSPITHSIFSSSSGGSFGMELKKAGYDGLVIEGKASSPVLIDIGKDIQILEASHLWGKTCDQIEEESKKGFMTIGPAGESLVRFAGIRADKRMFARGGCGAVLGSKNVKLIRASGDMKMDVANKNGFLAAVKEFNERIRKHSLTGDAFPNIGMPVLTEFVNEARALPTHNFQKGSFEQVDRIEGPQFKKFHSGAEPCPLCPIRCGKKGMMGAREVRMPEYETVAMFGSNLGVADPQKIIEWNYMCDNLGLDTISTANAIGYMMEAREKGIADFPCSFGNSEGVGRVIEDIAFRRGIGGEMAEGVASLSGKYGKEFAMVNNRLEAPAYDPRRAYGMGLIYATSGRCDHVGGFPFSPERMGDPVSVNPYSKNKARLVIVFQDSWNFVDSLVSCIFSLWGSYRGLPTSFVPASIVEFFALTMPDVAFYFLDLSYPKLVTHALGKRHSLFDCFRVGERVSNLERMFAVREGLVWDSVAPRFSEPLEGDSRAVLPLQDMLHSYYKLRGWNSRGTPTTEKLKKIGLEAFL